MNLAPIPIGQTFHHLTVLGAAPSTYGSHGKCTGRRVLVRCDCGTETTPRLAQVLSGGVKSCGCLRKYNHAGGRVKEGPKPTVPLGRPSDRVLLGRLRMLVHDDFDVLRVPRWTGEPIAPAEFAEMLGIDLDDLELRGGIFARWLGRSEIAGTEVLFHLGACCPVDLTAHVLIDRMAA